MSFATRNLNLVRYSSERASLLVRVAVVLLLQDNLYLLWRAIFAWEVQDRGRNVVLKNLGTSIYQVEASQKV